MRHEGVAHAGRASPVAGHIKFAGISFELHEQGSVNKIFVGHCERHFPKGDNPLIPVAQTLLALEQPHKSIENAPCVSASAVEEHDGVSQAPANFPSFEQYWPGPVIFFALHMQDTAALESGAQFGMHTPRFEPNGIDGTKPRMAPDTHVDAELQIHDSGFVDEQAADPHAGAGTMDVSTGQNQFGGIRTFGFLHRHTESVIEFNVHAGIDSSGMGTGIEFETGQEYPISVRTPPQLQGRETETPSAWMHVGKHAPLFDRPWASSEKMHSFSGGHKQFEFADGSQFTDPQTGWEHVPRTTVSFWAVPVKLDRTLQATSLPPPFSKLKKIIKIFEQSGLRPSNTWHEVQFRKAAIQKTSPLKESGMDAKGGPPPQLQTCHEAAVVAPNAPCTSLVLPHRGMLSK
ncbi:hypothetical protein BJ741DRAFT_667320 [Chytriomyces cf. hyalinus JEL632]|nr:hypothetical protein BJ741DRAFT_667320 [Chytriomyces cf. hyalinus JEL632]